MVGSSLHSIFLEVVKVLLTTLLGIKVYGPLICNSLKGKLKLESVGSVGEDIFSLGRYTKIGEDILGWDNRFNWGR